MGREDAFITGFFKTAGAPLTWLNPIKKYRAIAASPAFKAKKALGYGMIGAGAGAYVARKATQDPEQKAMGHDY